MTKYIVAVFAALLSCTPAISLAQGVGQINGNSQASQKLSTTTGVTTMHMDIITNQGVHTFQWDNTPWRVDQGGTGQSTFASGALLYGNGTSPLGAVAPGNLGDILQFNGTFPSWVAPSSLGIVAGNDGDIQFNNSGTIGADSSFKWYPGFAGTGMLMVPGIIGTTSYGGTARIEFLPPQTSATRIRGGTVRMQGADIGALDFDESGYSEGLQGGQVQIESGSASTQHGLAGPSGVHLIQGKWDSVTGWKGGDVEIFTGASFNYPGGGYPATPGKIIFSINQEDARAVLGLDSLTDERTFSFPDYSGTFGLLEATQKWTGTNTFSKGTAATTTVNFGEMGDATSHVCFNTKNTDGQDISFYFVGTSMVVENNVCQ